MTFEERLAQILEVLQREQRLSYRALKRRFDLDEEYLEDLKEEIIYAKRLAADEAGRVLVWLGDTTSPPPWPMTLACARLWRTATSAWALSTPGWDGATRRAPNSPPPWRASASWR
jgi:hypothetical protein